MTNAEIASRRLRRQGVTTSGLASPAEVVRSLVALQAQDYLGSLWAIGVRASDATEADVEAAIAARKIVRTWPMRGTIHFVAAEDVRWMLRLLAPRVIARYRKLVEDTILARSHRLFEEALAGGKQRTRGELYDVLEAAGISSGGQRGYHVLAILAQKGIICFGPRRGKQPTFVLLDEWVTEDRRLSSSEALAELASRYFASRGPATVYDFSAWSGLTIGDARIGIEMVAGELERTQLGNTTYWEAGSPLPASADKAVHLLPPFDETICGYKDRSAFLDPVNGKEMILKNGMISPTIVYHARVAGTWRRTLQNDRVLIEAGLFDNGQSVPAEAIEAAAQRYRKFLGVAEQAIEYAS